MGPNNTHAVDNLNVRGLFAWLFAEAELNFHRIASRGANAVAIKIHNLQREVSTPSNFYRHLAQSGSNLAPGSKVSEIN